MADSLTRIEYHDQCGNNFTMWYDHTIYVHLIGCRRCGYVEATITDRELALLDDQDPLIQRFYWMVGHGRLESTREPIGVHTHSHVGGAHIHARP